MLSSPSGGGERSLPTLVPNPCPPPNERVATLTEALIRERDGAHSAMVWLDSKLAAEWEAKRTVEVRAEVSWKKVAEVEEARQTTEGIVTELRSSLGLLETTRDATCSELHEAQQWRRATCI